MSELKSTISFAKKLVERLSSDGLYTSAKVVNELIEHAESSQPKMKWPLKMDRDEPVPLNDYIDGWNNALFSCQRAVREAGENNGT